MKSLRRIILSARSAVVLSASLLAAASAMPGTTRAEGAPRPTEWAHREGGTGVGNGTGTREESLRALRAQLGGVIKVSPLRPARVAPGAEDVVYPPSLSTELDQWCDRLMRLLSRQLRRARLELQNNRFENGIQVLTDAFSVASQSLDADPSAGSPLSKEMVDLGLQIAASLDEAMADDDQGRLSALQFLVTYTEFVIERIGDLDRPLYIPYVFTASSCRDGCNGSAFAELERRYLEYVRWLVGYVNDNFTTLNPKADGRLEARPVGAPRVYLILAQAIAGRVADGLAHTLRAYARACIVGDLADLATSLNLYNNHGDRSVWPYDAWAVDSVHAALAKAAEGVQGASCGPARKFK